MYYPKQVPYLLDKDFQENIDYREYKFEEIDSFCMCIWTMKSKNYANREAKNNILPDACIDIVIDFVACNICFAGFSKETMCLHLDKKIDFMGARLRPGAFFSLFKVSADKVMDQPIEFEAIDTDDEFLQILNSGNGDERLDIFVSYLKRKANNIEDFSYIRLVDMLYGKPEEKRVLELAKIVGYDDRHLRRLFKKHFGVSPRVLLNIMRLHLCLTLLLDKKRSLDEVMGICGFYDQSHFIKEIKRYTGFSPLELVDILEN